METDKNRYERGIIYSIRSYQTPDIYIGSTIDTLPRRIYQHKTNYKGFQNGKGSYIYSFEIIKYDDCYIELIESYPCKSKSELHRREGEIIRNTDCINKNIPGRSKSEYYQDNKAHILEDKKLYYEVNKDMILEQQKLYRLANKDMISKKGKQYYQANKVDTESLKK